MLRVSREGIGTGGEEGGVKVVCDIEGQQADSTEMRGGRQVEGGGETDEVVWISSGNKLVFCI